jgi:hypothetical protein
MGPWSVMTAGWMVLPAVYGRRSLGLVYDAGADIPADSNINGRPAAPYRSRFFQDPMGTPW